MSASAREPVRQAAGRVATPSAGIMDAQSVKTTEVGGTECGKVAEIVLAIAAVIEL